MCSPFPPGFPAVPPDFIHPFDLDAMPTSRRKTQNFRCIDAGLIKYTPARMEDFTVTCPLVPGGPTPRIRFLFVAPHLWMRLPPDPTSR